MRFAAGDIPLVVVGGAAQLCGDSLRGASSVVRPQHAAVANAVGAAIAQVSGTVDAIFDLGPTAASRTAVLHGAQQAATARAEAAGARPGSCWVAQQSEIPLAYLSGSFCRLTVKVIGDLDLGRIGAGRSGSGMADALSREQPQQPTGTPAGAAVQPATPAAVEFWPLLPGRGEEPGAAALAAWRPEVGAQGEWVLHEEDLQLLAVGAGILGCGGGGSPSKALLKAQMELQRYVGGDE